MVFQKATKQKAKLRMALTGPSGSGKTYSALNIAQYLGKKVCVVDTEGNSASKYANLFDFCTLSLTDCHPNNFIKAIDAAVAEGRLDLKVKNNTAYTFQIQISVDKYHMRGKVLSDAKLRTAAG